MHYGACPTGFGLLIRVGFRLGRAYLVHVIKKTIYRYIIDISNSIAYFQMEWYLMTIEYLIMIIK